MIIIYNLSGLVLGSAGILAGLIVFGVTGWLGLGLLTIAVIWFAGGLWWRNQEVSSGVKRAFPALFFIPLPFLAVPVATVAMLAFALVDWGGRMRPQNPQAELVRADERMPGGKKNFPKHIHVQRRASRGAAADAEASAGELLAKESNRIEGERPGAEKRGTDAPEAVASSENTPPPGAQTRAVQARRSPSDFAAARAKKREDAQAERTRQASKREMDRAERKQRSDERIAELKNRNNEQLATSMLEAAESQRQTGTTSDYRKKLKEIVDKYPETEAGKKAKSILK